MACCTAAAAISASASLCVSYTTVTAPAHDELARMLAALSMAWARSDGWPSLRTTMIVPGAAAAVMAEGVVVSVVVVLVQCVVRWEDVNRGAVASQQACRGRTVAGRAAELAPESAMVAGLAATASAGIESSGSAEPEGPVGSAP